MLAVLTLLIVVGLSLLVTRVAATALTLTGISHETARFQARSAYTGVGYTTTEAEEIVSHPIRRRIIMNLMLLGNVGIATVVATMMISFIKTTESEHWYWHLTLFIIGATLLWLGASSSRIEKRLNMIISRLLLKWTHLTDLDYMAILKLQDDYAIGEISIQHDDWIAEQAIQDSELTKEGIIVLGIIQKNGTYRGSPQPDAVIHGNDSLILYSTIQSIAELDKRKKGAEGDQAHTAAMETYQQHLTDPHRRGAG